MRRRWVPLLLLAGLGASCSFGKPHLISDVSPPASTIGNGWYRFGATTDGEMIMWEVSFADVANTPDWLPGEEPPLPVSKAIQLAEREVAKYTSIPPAYRLDKVEWMHLGNYMSDAGKWIYLVTFERQSSYQGRNFEARGTLCIPVLLDGRVIEGKREK